MHRLPKILFVLAAFLLSAPRTLPAACAAWTAADICGPYSSVGSGAPDTQYVYNLTNDVWQAGAIWNSNPLDLNNPFTVVFDMNFGDKNGVPQGFADGMSFVMQTDPSASTMIGNFGGAMGLSGIPDAAHPSNNHYLSPSVAVEFDSFQNSAANPPDTGDPAFDHIAIDENGNVVHTGCAAGTCPVPALASSADINDGFYHVIKITWDPVGHNLVVYFDDMVTPRLTYNKDMVANIFSGTSCVTMGFVGATGSSQNTQKVRLETCFPPTPTNTPSPTPYPVNCGTPVMETSIDVTANNGCLGASFSKAIILPVVSYGLLLVRIGGPSAPATLTLGGAPMTLVRTDATFSGTQLSTWMMVNPPSGSQTLASNISNCTYNVVAEVYSGVNQGNPIGATGVSTANGVQNYSTTLTTTGPASLISNFQAIANVVGTTTTLGTMQVSFGYDLSGVDNCCENVYGDYKEVDGPGLKTMTYHLNQTHNYTSQMVEVIGAPACGFVPTKTATPTRSPSNTPSPTYTPTWTKTGTRTQTPLPGSPTDSPTQTPSYTITKTMTYTRTVTPTRSPTPRYSATATPTNFVAPDKFKIITVYPNPINLSQSKGGYFVVSLPAPADVNFKLYNLRGELVLDKSKTYKFLGTYEYYWDGKNTGGADASYGAYYLIVKANEFGGSSESDGRWLSLVR